MFKSKNRNHKKKYAKKKDSLAAERHYKQNVDKKQRTTPFSRATSRARCSVPATSKLEPTTKHRKQFAGGHTSELASSFATTSCLRIDHSRDFRRCRF